MTSKLQPPPMAGVNLSLTTPISAPAQLSGQKRFPLLKSLASRVSPKKVWSTLRRKFISRYPPSAAAGHEARLASSSINEFSTANIAMDPYCNLSTSALPTTAVLSLSLNPEDQLRPSQLGAVTDHTQVNEEKAPENPKRSVARYMVRAISSVTRKIRTQLRSAPSRSFSLLSAPLLPPGEAAEGEVLLTIDSINMGTGPGNIWSGIPAFGLEAGIEADPPPPPPHRGNHELQATSTEERQEEEEKPFYLRVADNVPALAASNIATGIAFTLYIKATDTFSEPMRCAYYYFIGLDFVVGFSFWFVNTSSGPCRETGIVQLVLLGVGSSAIIIDVSLISFASLSTPGFAVVCTAWLATALIVALWIRRATQSSATR